MKDNFLDNFLYTRDTVGEFIEILKKDKLPVVLFGTGYCLNLFLDLMEENEIEIFSLCDNNSEKYGNKIKGYEVKSIQEVIKEAVNIVVSTSHYLEIEEQIVNAGFKGKIMYLPKPAYYKNTVYGKNYIKNKEKDFQEVFDLLEDKISKEVFVNIIKHNISIDESYFDEIDCYEINGYFGTELYCDSENSIIVDLGAYDGDTYRELIDKGYGYKEYIAFEPDKKNFEKLCLIKDPKIQVINKGAGERRERLKFSDGLGVSSNISQEGNIYIEVDSIDNVLPESKVTFIKMDIEGAEESALLGAKKCIWKNKPCLAVSAYHKKEDMFELVKLIKKLNKEYKIYFRHTFFYQKYKIQPDVIIYAV